MLLLEPRRVPAHGQHGPRGKLARVTAAVADGRAGARGDVDVGAGGHGATSSRIESWPEVADAPELSAMATFFRACR